MAKALHPAEEALLKVIKVKPNKNRQAYLKSIADGVQHLSEPQWNKLPENTAQAWVIKAEAKIAVGKPILDFDEVKYPKGKKPSVKDSKAAKATSKKSATRSRTDLPEDGKIKILVKENPFREGSDKYERLEALIKANGKTVKEFLALEGKRPALDKAKPSWAHAILRNSVKRKHAEIK